MNSSYVRLIWIRNTYMEGVGVYDGHIGKPIYCRCVPHGYTSGGDVKTMRETETGDIR